MVEVVEGCVCGDDLPPSKVYGGVVGEAVNEIADGSDPVTSGDGDGRLMETGDHGDGNVSGMDYDGRTGDSDGPYGVPTGSGGAVKTATGNGDGGYGGPVNVGENGHATPCHGLYGAPRIYVGVCGRPWYHGDRTVRRNGYPCYRPCPGVNGSRWCRAGLFGAPVKRDLCYGRGDSRCYGSPVNGALRVNGVLRCPVDGALRCPVVLQCPVDGGHRRPVGESLRRRLARPGVPGMLSGRSDDCPGC